jgi:nucleoside-diphosphate-sugar epimerase
LYKFIHAAIRGEPLIVMGSGNRCQDFICGTDIAEAVWKVISIVISGEKLKGIFNIANGSSISMKELAMLIVEVVGGGTVIQSETEEVSEIIDFRVDIEKAKASLGWQPKITVRNGVAALVKSLGGLE